MPEIDLPDIIQEISIGDPEKKLAKRMCRDILKLVLTKGKRDALEDAEKYVAWQLTQYKFEVCNIAQGGWTTNEIFKNENRE